MTREQAKKLLPAITHFASGGNLWYYSEVDKKWYKQSYIIETKISIKISNIIEDKHFEARKAFALGKEIEMYCPDKWVGWAISFNPIEWNDNYEYRPKEPVYEYQWVIQRNSDGQLSLTGYVTDGEFICGNEWQVIYKIPESKKVRKCS